MSYKKNLPRVSDIVSFVYPFDGYAKDRYIKWLEKNNISEEEYLSGANELGSFIHKQMENFIKNVEIEKDDILYKETKKHIKYGIEYLKQFKNKVLLTEVYLRDKNNRYQGTADLIIKTKDEFVVCDFKTFGIVKNRYGLENKFAVPKPKREKVGLQLSLYAYAYMQLFPNLKAKKVKLIFIHNEGVREYKIDILPKEKIDNILYLYKKSKKDNITIKLNTMENATKVTMRIPTETYGYIELEKEVRSKEDLESMFSIGKYSKKRWLSDEK